MNEIYAEFFIPVLKEPPGVYALNLTAVVRYSDYSAFGDTTNTTITGELRRAPRHLP